MTVSLPSIQKPGGKASPGACASPGSQAKTTDLNVLEDILNKYHTPDGSVHKKNLKDPAIPVPVSPNTQQLDSNFNLPQLIDDSKHGRKQASAFQGILRQCSLCELIFATNHQVQLLCAGAFDESPDCGVNSAFLPSISGKKEDDHAHITDGSKENHKKEKALPGGVHLWRCGVLLSYFIAQNPQYISGQNALELGAGTGLVGLVASQLCDKILITDYNRKLVQLINHNIVLNQMEDNASATTLDWTSRSDIKRVLEDHPDGFDLVLAADTLYEDSALEPFWQTARQLLSGHGAKLLMAHENRSSRLDGKLFMFAAEAGFSVETIAIESFMPADIKGLWGNLILKRSDYSKFFVLVCTLLGPMEP
mmetsp:Transcript_25219/g.30531  ORF Transcript_25219/g.30531 Transcript_25219/m.30531 type:complete len:365 (+) Transcript_25219:365-1459(+)|eukprot:CAMPEP_0197849834 /NCGR_PEP_ID=MMETSP1438-20131217/13362_1 /TAXON_ID=1461541 /ORGANISM="Pterosperma sp., Strain CCMP1384" /LENGTH=364 /DNA_ID=CAMNT_0043462693 /DNA_START=356 /DNA_END=1450 /DNA_ORIENTATION=-